MNKSSLERRDFLKTLGIGSVAGTLGLLSETVISGTVDGKQVRSSQQYGGFDVEKLKLGKRPYMTNPDILKAMPESRNAFSRNVWDPERLNRPRENLTHERLIEGQGKIPNQTRLDYALYAASWHTASARTSDNYSWELYPRMVRGTGLPDLGPWDPADLDMDWEEASLAVKHAGLFYGASLVGIAHLNRKWIYSDGFTPTRQNRKHSVPVLADGDRFGQTDDAWYIPESMNRVVVLAFEEDYHAITNSPGRLASAAVGNGYSRMAFTAPTLAEFIRALGYRAIPAGNGVGLSIPMAIDAGLGELGRMGLLVTPKYGPRVRLAKVITDMPLLLDAPIRFGVTEFCEVCMLCADDCPSESITKAARSWEGTSVSNNPGTYKWYVHPETCYDFNGFSCSNCKRVCPFTKPNNSWLHQLIRKGIDARIKPMNKVMVQLDQASGYGRQTENTEFWKMDGQKSITARESM